ncbi:MAG: thioredoxin family protein [Pirellulales bacterium]
MRRQLCCGALLLLVVVAGCGPSPPAVTYSVAKYDPARDPAADLAATIDQAQASGKRILLQVGGDWCSWCHRLDAFIKIQPKVAQALGENFILMKVNSSEENRNQEFLAQFPEVPAYPHWFVLDSDGKLLHSQSTAELEAGETYSQPAILMFIDQWKAGGGA